MNTNRIKLGIIRPCLVALIVAGMIVGCRSQGPDHYSADRSKARRASVRTRVVSVKRIACIYDARPWLSLDAAGDRDPEGIWFRVFLDPGTGLGVHAEGTFHVEMYRIDRQAGLEPQRILASDWHYPASDMPTIRKPGMLGDGFVLQLRWADKDIAGNEIEMITRFEDALGNVVRSGAKRLRVPKYES